MEKTNTLLIFFTSLFHLTMLTQNFKNHCFSVESGHWLWFTRGGKMLTSESLHISCQLINNYFMGLLQHHLSKRMLVTFRTGWIFAQLPRFLVVTFAYCWLTIVTACWASECLSRVKACLDIFNLVLHLFILLFILPNNPTKLTTDDCALQA